MSKANHKYRATIYLGKEIYEALDKMAHMLNISVPTLTTIIFKTGWEISKTLDRKEVNDQDGK